jgi:hypothetical protein
MSIKKQDQAETKAHGKLVANRAPERPDLSRLIEESKVKFAAMSPEEKEAMYLAQRQNWAAAEMALDRKTDSSGQTRIIATGDGERTIATEAGDVFSIAHLIAALQSAEEEFNRISCEGVTETRSVADALERAKFFADRGAVAARSALCQVTANQGPAKVDASDIGRALKV